MRYRASEYASLNGEKYLADNYARHFQRGVPLGASSGDFKRLPPVLTYCNKQNCLKPLWKSLILPEKILTLLSSFITAHCTCNNWGNMSTARIAASYLFHYDFKINLYLSLFPSIDLVKYAYRAKIPPCLRKRIEKVLF